MKTAGLIVSMFTALFLMAVLSPSGSALAISEDQSAQSSQEKKDNKQGMGMQGDMSACCKRKMGGKEKTDAMMESMDEQKNQGKEGQTDRKQTARIAVTEKGFEPSTIRLKPNTPAQLTFVRQTDKTCATSVAIPEYKVSRELPLNKPVVIEFTPRSTGEFTFACGMGMLKGQVIVEEKDKN